MSSPEPPVIYNSDVRERLRKRGEPVRLRLALTERERDVRMTVPTIALDRYDEVPDGVEAWYLPDEHAIVIDLPAAKGQQRLADCL